MNFLAFVSVSVGLINPASIMYKAEYKTLYPYHQND